MKIVRSYCISVCSLHCRIHVRNHDDEGQDWERIEKEYNSRERHRGSGGKGIRTRGNRQINLSSEY